MTRQKGGSAVALLLSVAFGYTAGRAVGRKPAPRPLPTLPPLAPQSALDPAPVASQPALDLSSPAPHRVHRTSLRRFVGTVLVCLALSVGATCVVARVFDVRAVPVLTGSMTPVASAGSLVLTTPVKPGGIERGDIIAFKPPAPYAAADSRPYLHRVEAIDQINGQLVLVTKGDANPAPDPWRLVLDDSGDYGRERLIVPHLGTLVAGGTRSALLYGGGLLLLLAASTQVRRSRREIENCTCDEETTEIRELQPA